MSIPREEGVRKKIHTGCNGLDWLTRGGVPAGSLLLVAGDPGSGKTILAHQIASTLGPEERTVYLTALVEAHGTIQAQIAAFDFFGPSTVGRQLYYASVHAAFKERGLEAVRVHITEFARNQNASLVVLDGLHALKASAEDPSEYHRFVSALQAHADATGLTLIVISNRADGDAADPMYTIADGILLLQTEKRGEMRVRRLEVRKLRTVGQVMGQHAFEITPRGITVYPRLEARAARIEDPQPGPGPEALQSFGVEGLDRMLGGGIEPGSATLVIGPAGAGKTSLGLAYLTAGLEEGQRGVFMGFHEPPAGIVRKGESIGLPLRKHVAGGSARLFWHTAAEIPADRCAHRLLEAVEELDATRVVIDGMDDFLGSPERAERRLSFVAALIDLLRARGTSILLTMQLPEVFSLDLTVPVDEIPSSIDNIILLRYQEVRSETRGLVSIVKVRSQGTDPATREFFIRGEKGPVVDEPFTVVRRMVGRGASEPGWNEPGEE